MRVAYRESVGKTVQGELILEKQIMNTNMYAKICLQIESTLDDFDMQEIQKKKFESLESNDDATDAYNLSTSSFNLEENSMSGLNTSDNSQNLFSANQITKDYENLQPVQERIKLEGDEYESKRRNKDLATSASYEIYRSLESLPIEQMLSM